MRILPALFCLLALFSTHAAAQALPDAGEAGNRDERPGESANQRRGWLYFETPLWDISNEGLPFRLTAALPSRRDPLTRVLFAREARWTFSAGYAKIYNSYDAATGMFKSPGGHAALLSAGRQYRWHLPEVAGALTPKVALEFGVSLSSRRFPADGTYATFKLITGLEWTWRNRADTAEWSLGVMWPHFSNANLLSRNAGYDGLSLRVGRSVRF